MNSPFVLVVCRIRCEAGFTVAKSYFQSLVAKLLKMSSKWHLVTDAEFLLNQLMTVVAPRQRRLCQNFKMHADVFTRSIICLFHFYQFSLLHLTLKSYLSRNLFNSVQAKTKEKKNSQTFSCFLNPLACIFCCVVSIQTINNVALESTSERKSYGG